MENISKEQYHTLSLKGEFYRKTIHIFSSSIPIGYYFLSKDIVLSVLLPLLFCMVVVEMLKYKSETVYSLYLKYFKFLLREHEFNKDKFRINGASWVLLADVVCIILFPKYIAISGMLLLSLADSSSAVIGRMYGKKQFAPNRSYAGTFAFFVTGVIIVLLSPKYVYQPMEYYLGLTAVAVTTLADSVKFPVDDNFAIPVIFSGLLYILYIIFLPSILLF
jgi:dolichol kinase